MCRVVVSLFGTKKRASPLLHSTKAHQWCLHVHTLLVERRVNADCWAFLMHTAQWSWATPSYQRSDVYIYLHTHNIHWWQNEACVQRIPQNAVRLRTASIAHLMPFLKAGMYSTGRSRDCVVFDSNEYIHLFHSPLSPTSESCKCKLRNYKYRGSTFKRCTPHALNILSMQRA